MQPRTNRLGIIGCGVIALAAGVMFILPHNMQAARAAAEPEPTAVGEVVMYAIDSDTNQLLRYGFDSNEYRVIGTVHDADGNQPRDLESLAYIPNGPAAGLYSSPQEGTGAGHLLRISMLDASATVFAGSLDHGDLTGLLARQDLIDGNWYLYGTTLDDKLIQIDPLTGDATVVTSLSRAYEGLTIGPDGTWYGARESELWTIDPATGDETLLGTHDYLRVESLEYAYGDENPGVTLPGIPADWTDDGVLFGFADDDNTLIVFNPADGDAWQWDSPVVTPDAEGLVFMTKSTDPLFRVSVEPFD